MAPGDLGSEFDRFRRRGDVAALGRVFDGAAPELLGLALHLTRGLDQAEDLVQATFLAAIEGARGYDSKRPLMPWLLGILVRQASKARRAAGRSIDPERMPERDVPDPLRESEASEISEVIAGAVRALPQRYREVLEAHLIEGKRAVAIAHDLERAPGTVRMQILRGLELLRQSLPPGLATGVAALALGSRGLAEVRACVVRQAKQAAPALAAATAPSLSTAWLLGGALVSAKMIWSSLAVLGLAAGSWFALRSDSRAVAPDRSPAPALELARSEPRPRATTGPRAVSESFQRRASESLAPAATRAQEREALPGWWLVGQVTGVRLRLVAD
jgi:RNA polymerase sigma-70 factor (ECF subfamily)